MPKKTAPEKNLRTTVIPRQKSPEEKKSILV
jgi:hypothetical protein